MFPMSGRSLLNSCVVFRILPHRRNDESGSTRKGKEER